MRTSSAFVFLLALAAAAPAQEPASRVELKRVELSGAPGMEVVTSVTEYKPGDVLERHLHHGIESLYVIQGSMIQVPGKDPQMLKTGTSLLNLRDVPHGGFRVVGEQSLILFTTHVVDKGRPLYDQAN